MAESTDLLSGLVQIGRDYVSGTVRVSLESNVLPPVALYSGAAGKGGGLGLGKLLGLRAGIVVRNAKGETLAKFGDPAKVQPLRALLLAAGVVGVGYLGYRLLRALR